MLRAVEETIHVTEDGTTTPTTSARMELLHVLNHGGNGDEDPAPVGALSPPLPIHRRRRVLAPENIRELQFEEVVDKTSELSMKFNEYALRHAIKTTPPRTSWALAMVHSRSSASAHPPVAPACWSTPTSTIALVPRGRDDRRGASARSPPPSKWTASKTQVPSRGA